LTSNNEAIFPLFLAKFLTFVETDYMLIFSIADISNLKVK